MRKSNFLIALLAIAGTAIAQPYDPLQVRSWAAGCTACHAFQAPQASQASQASQSSLAFQTSPGQADPIMPPLAGAGREAMAAALLDFKSGRRPASVMQQLARGYDDEQLRAIAAYFDGLKQP